MDRRTRYAYLLILPAVVLVLFLIVWPTIFLIYASTLDWTLTLGGISSAHLVGALNYVTLLTSSSFYDPILLATFEFAAGALAVETLLGLGLALLFSVGLRGIRVFRAAIALPIFFAPITVGYLFYYVFEPSLGIANYFLRLIGLPASLWYTDSSTAILSLILTDVWQWTPFIFLIVVAGLASLPNEPFEAASLDGAGAWRKFRDLTFPMLLPILLVAMLLRLLALLRNVDIIYAITQGGPNRATQVFAYNIYFTGFQSFSIGQAAAQSVILLIIANILASFFVRRYWGRGR